MVIAPYASFLVILLLAMTAMLNWQAYRARAKLFARVAQLQARFAVLEAVGIEQGTLQYKLQSLQQNQPESRE